MFRDPREVLTDDTNGTIIEHPRGMLRDPREVLGDGTNGTIIEHPRGMLRDPREVLAALVYASYGMSKKPRRLLGSSSKENHSLSLRVVLKICYGISKICYGMSYVQWDKKDLSLQGL